MAEEKCPSCGTPYEEDATFCINCGAKREAPAPAPSPEATAPAESETMKPTAAPPEETSPEEKKAGATAPASAAAPQETAPERETPVPEEPPAPTPEPPPPAAAAQPAAEDEDDVLARLDARIEEVEGHGPPKKKSKKGCCIAGVIFALLLFFAAGCAFLAYRAGYFDELGLAAGDFRQDFSEPAADAVTIWQKGPGVVVKQEKGMLKVKNALVGINYGSLGNCSATCSVIFQGVAKEHGWAGLVLRVNPKGGDRYAFELLPQKKLIKIEKITAAAKPVVLARARIPALTVGQQFTLGATASGSDLTMTVNGTEVAHATDIGLLEGPVGLEARAATAYFDDLVIEAE